jgi:pimeloyl-ACP methyl ester carboxylesterase
MTGKDSLFCTRCQFPLGNAGGLQQASSSRANYSSHHTQNCSFIARRLLDKFLLEPSAHPIPTPGKTRRLVPHDDDHIEIWSERSGAEEPVLFVLKFPGSGGRAERASIHPFDVWTDLPGEIWAVNPPGYGCSPGRPSVRKLITAARAAYEQLRSVAGDRPIVVTGNSLGTVTALHVAASFKVAGLILRNPPPLRQVIVRRHGWWSLWLGAMLIARQVPEQLDSIQNAARATVPAVFITSGKDRLVPPGYQRRVLNAYAGEKRLMRLKRADHATPMTETEQAQYADLLLWLRERIF